MRNMRTLTEAQRIQWETDGYIILEGALNPDEVKFFSNELDEVRKKPGYEPRPGELPRGHYGCQSCGRSQPGRFHGSTRLAALSQGLPRFDR